MTYTKRKHTIALAGHAGAGKDTVADTLVQYAGFTKIAFADALRQEIVEGYGLSVDEQRMLHERDMKEVPNGRLSLSCCNSFAFQGAVLISQNQEPTREFMNAPRSPRQIMQWWGTEYRRAEAPAYWTRRAMEHVQSLQKVDGLERVVLTDCRFDNEAATVRRAGGVVWRVARPSKSPIKSGHVSETSGVDFAPEATIYNDGDLWDLAEHTLGRWWAHEAGFHRVEAHIWRDAPAVSVTQQGAAA